MPPTQQSKAALSVHVSSNGCLKSKMQEMLIALGMALCTFKKNTTMLGWAQNETWQ